MKQHIFYWRKNEKDQEFEIEFHKIGLAKARENQEDEIFHKHHLYESNR